MRTNHSAVDSLGKQPATKIPPHINPTIAVLQRIIERRPKVVIANQEIKFAGNPNPTPSCKMSTEFEADMPSRRK
jgi:hypothetical protein